MNAEQVKNVHEAAHASGLERAQVPLHEEAGKRLLIVSDKLGRVRRIGEQRVEHVGVDGAAHGLVRVHQVARAQRHVMKMTFDARRLSLRSSTLQQQKQEIQIED